MKNRIKRVIIGLLTVGFLFMQLGLMDTTVKANRIGVLKGPIPPIDAHYYVSALGDDTTGDGSLTNPFASLAKTASVINGISPAYKHYHIHVLSDLTSSACARFYDNNVTISSEGGRFTVTRAAAFAQLSDTRRSWYNPAMLELGGTNLTTGPELFMIIENVIFDDVYRHDAAGTYFTFGPPTASPWTVVVHDAIVASYYPGGNIVLGDKGELRNFGGMSAIRAADYAKVLLKDGSLITDVGANANSTRVGPNINSQQGHAAVSLSNADFYMEDGAMITNIANVHGIHASGRYKFFLDGTVSGLIGSNGQDVAADGRGLKNAVCLFDNVLDETGNLGFGTIGENARIINNRVKCGAVLVSGVNVKLRIFGQINNNTNLGGGTLNQQGTNGAGLYIVRGSEVHLEDGSTINNNLVSGISGYGGAVSVQQGGGIGSILVMNGGTINGNTAPYANAIAVNKDGARFIMNGGVISNVGTTAVAAVSLVGDGQQTTGIIELNGGTISSVAAETQTTAAGRLLIGAVPNPGNLVYGNVTQRHLVINGSTINSPLYIGSRAGITTASSIRRVTPISGKFKIGVPNVNTYTDIRNSLPANFTLPINDNVVGFYVQAAESIKFSVPRPTTGYDATNNDYWVAFIPVNDSGSTASGSLQLYPADINGSNVEVTLPINAFNNGGTAVLIQRNRLVGELVFEAPLEIIYNKTLSSYTIPYQVTYDMPLEFFEKLIIDSHTKSNTNIILVIKPDPKTIGDVSSFSVVNSEIFEYVGPATWVSGELRVPLELKVEWDLASDLESIFSFTTTLPQSNFVAGEHIYLTGEMTTTSNPLGQQGIYLKYGNTTDTLLRDNPQTNDKSTLWIWSLMILTGFFAVVTIPRKAKKH